MNDPRKAAIERRLRRLYGPSPGARERVQQFLEEQSDWFGWCRHCGEPLSGTIAEVSRHRCKEYSDASG